MCPLLPHLPAQVLDQVLLLLMDPRLAHPLDQVLDLLLLLLLDLLLAPLLDLVPDPVLRLLEALPALLRNRLPVDLVLLLPLDQALRHRPAQVMFQVLLLRMCPVLPLVPARLTSPVQPQVLDQVPLCTPASNLVMAQV